MPRNINGYKFMERYRNSDDAYDEYKAIRCYSLTFNEINVKVLSLVNQFGQGYRDIYVKKGAHATMPM